MIFRTLIPSSNVESKSFLEPPNWTRNDIETIETTQKGLCGPWSNWYANHIKNLKSWYVNHYSKNILFRLSYHSKVRKSHSSIIVSKQQHLKMHLFCKYDLYHSYRPLRRKSKNLLWCICYSFRNTQNQFCETCFQDY